MNDSTMLTENALPKAGQILALKALIVDDSEFDRKHLRRMCRRAGLKLEFSEASDIASMCKKLDAESFDLIFLDYHLEIETGLEALAEVVVHQKQSDAISIMVTSVDSHETVIEAMRNGCSDYLIKSELTPDTIRKSITSAIERRILIAAIAEERAFRDAMRKTIARFSTACAPEMRAIMSAMLRRVRSIRNVGSVDLILAENLASMERSCDELFRFLDDLTAVLDQAPGQASLTADRLLPKDGQTIRGPRDV